jgi:hypothetical protein
MDVRKPGTAANLPAVIRIRHANAGYGKEARTGQRPDERRPPLFARPCSARRKPSALHWQLSPALRM